VFGVVAITTGYLDKYVVATRVSSLVIIKSERTAACSASCAFRRVSSDAWALESGVIRIDDGPAPSKGMDCEG